MTMMMMSQAQDRDKRREESVQLRGTPGDLANRTAFRDYAVNVQQFRVYLVMLGGQTHVSMIHTPGVYYSIASTTNTYQGNVLAFIGDRRDTKEPTPICLPRRRRRGNGTPAMRSRISTSLVSSTTCRRTRVPCGRQQLATGPPPNSRSQILSPSRMCSSISSALRARRSRHTTYCFYRRLCPRKWRAGSSLGLHREMVPGGRPSECQRKKQGVS